MIHTSSTPLHELMHDIVDNELREGKKSKIFTLKTLWNSVIFKSSEAAYNELQTAYVQRLNASGDSRGNSELSTTTGGLGSSKRRHTGRYSDYEQMLRYVTSSQGAEGGINQSGNGTRNGSGRISSKQTRVHPQKMEQHSMESSLQNGSRNREEATVRGAQKVQVEHGRRVGEGELFSKWDSARAIISQFTAQDMTIPEGESHSRAFEVIRRKLMDVLWSDTLTMTDKMTIVGAWYNDIKNLDSKYRTGSGGYENMHIAIMNDEKIFHEILV